MVLRPICYFRLRRSVGPACFTVVAVHDGRGLLESARHLTSLVALGVGNMRRVLEQRALVHVAAAEIHQRASATMHTARTTVNVRRMCSLLPELLLNKQ